MLLDIAAFSADGFLVLRRFFEPTALGTEIDRTLAAAADPAHQAGPARFQYAPMMSDETPHSLLLLDRVESVAEALVGAPVLPVRAKGVRYVGSTAWHVDSSRELVSIGFAAYLEPLSAERGALRVVPGSHRGSSGAPDPRALGGNVEPAAWVALDTEPGDVIAFDEHLLHASVGGSLRRQWRADYFRAPATAFEAQQARAYLAAVFPPDWNGGYDVDRFPSYGRAWLQSGRPSVEALAALGAYELAAAQEAYVRSQRTSGAN